MRDQQISEEFLREAARLGASSVLIQSLSEPARNGPTVRSVSMTIGAVAGLVALLGGGGAAIISNLHGSLLSGTVVALLAGGAVTVLIFFKVIQSVAGMMQVIAQTAMGMGVAILLLLGVVLVTLLLLIHNFSQGAGY